MVTAYDYSRQIKTLARLTPTLGSANGGVDPWAALDGSTVVMPWQQAYVNAGLGRHVTVGAKTTPIQGGGAGTVYDDDQPEFIISVPSGTAIMPLRFHIQCQVPLLAADSEEAEMLIAVDRTQAWDAVGTSTTEVAFNMRTDIASASACTIASAVTGNMTAAPTLGLELARAVLLGDFQGTPANAMWTPFDLLYEPSPAAPIIHGPAMVVGYWGGTVAVTGFAQLQWIEFSSTYDPVVGG